MLDIDIYTTLKGLFHRTNYSFLYVCWSLCLVVPLIYFPLAISFSGLCLACVLSQTPKGASHSDRFVEPELGRQRIDIGIYLSAGRLGPACVGCLRS